MNLSKAWLYAAVATVALAGAAPAYAVTTVNGSPGNTIPFAEGNGSFSNPDVAAGVFTDQFFFTVNQAGFLTALSATSVGTNQNNDIEGFTLTLSGPAGFTPVTATDVNGGAGFIAVASIGNTLLTQLGQYTLTVSGDAGRQGSSYGGSYSFSAVPGPIAGAGLPALLALGGLVWARRRKTAAVA